MQQRLRLPMSPDGSQVSPPNKQIAANAAVLEGTLPHKALRVQKLSEVKGIGTVFEQRLYDAGLGTFWEVSHLPDEEFQQILEVPDWQMMLLDLDAIREDALRLARESDTVGTILENLAVDDFEMIPGIGAVYERRLYNADIHTYEALGSISVETLAAICQSPRTQAPDYAAGPLRPRDSPNHRRSSPRPAVDQEERGEEHDVGASPLFLSRIFRFIFF